jgi:hypothetical protein
VVDYSALFEFIGSTAANQSLYFYDELRHTHIPAKKLLFILYQ